MISIEEAKRLAKKTLSEKRYKHTRNVQKLAVKLAKIHGEDKNKAALAALLHDIAKEMPKDKMLQICLENDIMPKDMKLRPVSVWHGIVASILAKNVYGIDDEEILNAIAYHTTGNVNMSRLDKIIYMADMASEERTYPEAKELRDLALKNLDEATIKGLGQSIAWLKQDKKHVDNVTLEAYATLRKTYYGGTRFE